MFLILNQINISTALKSTLPAQWIQCKSFYLSKRWLEAISVVRSRTKVTHHQVLANLLPTHDAVPLTSSLIHALIAVPKTTNQFNQSHTAMHINAL
jgi:hypothetical protein